MNLLTPIQLEKLTTHRLLSYKAGLMKVPETESESGSDYTTKDQPEWKLAYADVKAVLATREHVA
jgi:hypothetical protein